MPLSFLVFVGLIVLLLVAPVGLKLVTTVLSRRRLACPSCGVKALAMTGGVVAGRLEHARPGQTWGEYECENCAQPFVKPLGGGLILRQAWIAGATEVIPTAVVISRPPTDRSS